MTLASFVAAGLLLALSSTSAMAQGVRPDGNSWIKEIPAVKSSLVAGVLYGMSLGRDFALWDIPGFSVEKPPPAAQAAMDSYTSMIDKYLRAHVTVSQIQDGLDQFYMDFRNRSIVLDRAIWLVLNAIAGRPEPELQRLIESHRRFAN